MKGVDGVGRRRVKLQNRRGKVKMVVIKFPEKNKFSTFTVRG